MSTIGGSICDAFTQEFQPHVDACETCRDCLQSTAASGGAVDMAKLPCHAATDMLYSHLETCAACREIARQVDEVFDPLLNLPTTKEPT